MKPLILLKGNLYFLSKSHYGGRSFVSLIYKLVVLDHLEQIKIDQVHFRMQKGHLLLSMLKLFVRGLDQFFLTLSLLAFHLFLGE